MYFNVTSFVWFIISILAYLKEGSSISWAVATICTCICITGLMVSIKIDEL